MYALSQFIEEMREFEENESDLSYNPPTNNIQRMEILLHIIIVGLHNPEKPFKSEDNCEHVYSLSISNFISEMCELEESEPDSFYHDIPKNNIERMEIISFNLIDMISFAKSHKKLSDKKKSVTK
jgi:hypothetical protein